MAKFVRCSTPTTGDIHYVNVDQISSMMRSTTQNYTVIRFGKDHSLNVQQPPEEIMRLADETMRT